MLSVNVGKGIRQWHVFFCAALNTRNREPGTELIPIIRVESITTKSDDTTPMERKCLNTQRIIRFRPTQLLVKFGFSYGLNFSFTQSYRGWKHCLETFRCVPDDSLIFDFCRSGNIQGVETLSRTGKASVWDTDSAGWTPLHVCGLYLVNYMVRESLIAYPVTDCRYIVTA
jgi:hypothetical protein